MNVDTMRAIDRYAGVPISFVLGIFYWLASLVMPKKTVPISKVLFIELSEMGSAIIADPAMRKLRDGAGAQLYFVIFKNNVLPNYSINKCQQKRRNAIFIHSSKLTNFYPMSKNVQYCAMIIIIHIGKCRIFVTVQLPSAMLSP